MDEVSCVYLCGEKVETDKCRCTQFKPFHVLLNDSWLRKKRRKLSKNRTDNGRTDLQRVFVVAWLTERNLSPQSILKI